MSSPSTPDGEGARVEATKQGDDAVRQHPPPAPRRFRLRFEKRGALKYISHHDLMRTFELALRRAGVAVAHTQGFNPRPRLSFAMALPLGVESLDEILDIDLRPEVVATPHSLVAALAPHLPPGISLLEAWQARGRPAVSACEYRVQLELDSAQLEGLTRRLAEFMAGGAVSHTRSRGRGKPARVLDARAFTLEASLDASILRMKLAFTPQGGMKPTDLLEVLGLDPLGHPITKTKTHFTQAQDSAPAGGDQPPEQH
ncbi:MAG: hypothetical protein DPW14_16860 [Planctomycetes bacterium]|nr:hypothetical protein [Planctomycetota bacterium]